MAAAHHPPALRRLGRIAAHATAPTPTPTAATVAARLRLRPLAPKDFGAVAELTVAEATGSPEVRQALREALDEHAVLCLRFGVDLDEGTMREVMEVFGPIKDRVGRCRDGVVRPYTAGQPGSRVDEELKVLNSSRALDGSGGGPSNWQCVAIPTATPSPATPNLPDLRCGQQHGRQLLRAAVRLHRAPPARAAGLGGRGHTLSQHATRIRGPAAGAAAGAGGAAGHPLAEQHHHRERPLRQRGARA